MAVEPGAEHLLGALTIPIGDTGRGLCGGMVFAARDRFERGEPAPPGDQPPPPGTPLFKEIVDRQFASFGPFWSVPLRFWLASAGNQAGRDRETVQDAWPAIKAEIDAGRPAMVGIVKIASWNPLSIGLGHQVVAYRYDESSSGITLWMYDPNYPGRDDVTITVRRREDGTYEMVEFPTDSVIGLLSLPFSPAP